MSTVKKDKGSFLDRLLRRKDKGKAKNRLSPSPSAPESSHGSVTPAPNKILSTGNISDNTGVELSSASSPPDNSFSSWAGTWTITQIDPNIPVNHRQGIYGSILFSQKRARTQGLQQLKRSCRNRRNCLALHYKSIQRSLTFLRFQTMK